MANELLNRSEQVRLNACKEIIVKGMATVLEVAGAMVEIRDGRLYRAKHKTFEEFCQTEFGLTRQRVNQLIKHKQLVQNLETMVSKNEDEEELFPEINERQARELSKVEPEKQAEVLAKASEDGPPTAAKIREAAAEVEAEEEEEIEATPDERMVAWNSDVESFCRGLVKFAKDNCPSGQWMDESRQTIALDQVKSAAATYRLATGKAICPKCEGEGCKTCLATGFLPRRQLEMIG